VFHAWFEQVAWLEDGPPDDATLQCVARALPGGGVELSSRIAEFRRMLSQPAIRDALSQSGYRDYAALGLPAAAAAELATGPVKLNLWRERSFALREDDVLLQGAIDRVVLLERGGRALAADVVDFKTDYAPDEAALVALVEHYRPQIAAYRRAVARLLRLDLQRITGRLLFVGAGAVRRVV
jgi:ATP-dependent exoDNAse (exonuclease V) beta subunit